MLKRNIHINPKKKKKGQSTVEYIIMVAAVVAALLIFFGANGPFSTAFNQTMVATMDGMVNMAERLNASRP